MKAILISFTIAAGLSTIAVTSANAGSGYGRSYAYEYCYYYKTRALGAKSRERKQVMWAKYHACLREYGG